jgi:hypothetical protein
MKYSLIHLGLILLFASAESHLNLYLNEHETMTLLGKTINWINPGDHPWIM